ncbi:MAG TPA: thioredoxin domain-containing protein [Myxococcota bacterium]|nr:thioredoxin domain-containing protein [Myxococcota bacterium]
MISRFHLTRAAGVLCGLLLACSTREGASPEGGPSSGQVVAQVAGKPVTLGELEAWMKEDLFKHEVARKNPSELFELRSDALDRMLAERLLAQEAKRRGETIDDLMKEETAKAPAVSDEEVSAFYEQNKARAGNQTLEQLAPNIRKHLEHEKKQEAWSRYLDSLREQEKVVVLLEQPRVKVAADGPARGPQDAPVTIVEFSDFQCPFCRRAESTVKQVLDRYQDRVRFVYRHFPLEMHPRAQPAAEAAACADEQGRFWDYHAKLFEGGLEDADLQRYATELGLNAAAFQECVAQHKTKDVVTADFEAGKAAGVSGTPAFFVNGIMISGARPVDSFTKVIDKELQQGAKAGG